MNRKLLVLLTTLALTLTACKDKHAGHDHGKSGGGKKDSAHKHEHTPPHGGAPVVLGEEEYHLEFVRDAAAGKLQLYVLDGHLDKFIRIAAPAIEVTTTIAGAPQALSFKPVPNTATGEKVGDTSLYEAQADWIKTATNFDAVVKLVDVKGKTFKDVKFNFPKGNED
ncbi:MAG: hypothetical protein FJ406_05140 [Verrucomicrobia bacterium]|nr:hypothetical protein [Verrucomicrobiota bacterium]MBM3871200.1 hypothetical protein [Verrucomicrobiota bacterium]